MRDDFLGPVWAANHGSVSHFIHKLGQRLNAGFERLTARQFDAPWRRASRTRIAGAR